MIHLTKQKGKKIGILGLSRTGKSVFKALQNNDIICYDDSEKTCEEFKKQYGSNYIKSADDKGWAAIDKLVVSPGVPQFGHRKHRIIQVAEENNIEITSDMDLLYEEYPDACYIGITGSNGKSTTTSLIGHILSQSPYKFQVGGNIGVPCLELEPPEDGYVLEISSFQLDLLKKLRLNVALLLNITENHLDVYENMEAYTKSKLKILSLISDNGAGIIGGIDRNLIKNTIGNSKSLHFLEDLRDYEFKHLDSMKGEHNKENMKAGLYAVKEIFDNDSIILDAISTFKGLPHRMEFVENIEGISFYNDSKATTAIAAEKSLMSFENIYWLLGGVEKSGGIEPLLKYAPQINSAFLFGKSKHEFAKVMEGKVKYEIVETMEEGVLKAFEEACKDKFGKKPVILLAPACASYDQFKDYEDRGNQFKEIARRLKCQDL